MLSLALAAAALAWGAPRQVDRPPVAAAAASTAKAVSGPAAAAQAAPPRLPAQATSVPSIPAASPADVSGTRQLFSIRGEEGKVPSAAALSRAYDGTGSRVERVVALAAPWRTETQLRKLTASPRPAGETFRFNVVGDGEEGRFWFTRKLFNSPGAFPRQLLAADRENADFTVQLGDMVSRGTPRHFLKFFQMLNALRLRLPLLTTPGNHDRHRPHGLSDLRLYKKFFGATDYHMDRGGWRFVFLDSSARRVTAGQLAWLDRALDTSLKTVVFTHVPPGPLSAWTDWGPFKAAGGIGEGGAKFMAIAAKRGVEAVFMGHIHAFDVAERDGVRYYLTGGGGSPLYPAPSGRPIHHYLHVEAGPNGLRVAVRK